MKMMSEIKALHTSGIYANSGNETIKNSLIDILLLPFKLFIKSIMFILKIFSFCFGSGSSGSTNATHFYSGHRRKPLTNDERLRIFAGRLGYNKNDPTVPKELRDKLKY